MKALEQVILILNAQLEINAEVASIYFFQCAHFAVHDHEGLDGLPILSSLSGVHFHDTEVRTSGGLGNIHRGMYEGKEVALKDLRKSYSIDSASEGPTKVALGS